MNLQNKPAPDGVTLETVVQWLRHRADGMYGGEAVTQLQHALQCATLAQAEGASVALVTAALLHDAGHLAINSDDVSHPHAEMAAHLLGDLFHPHVTEPIRLHVDAKRYLCAVDPLYGAGLSRASRRSLEWQGGAFSPAEAEVFIASAFAGDAVRLRRWDDAAKVPGAVTADLDHFIKLMQPLCIARTAMEVT
ncbi:MAG: HD domain-containing protein [Pseudomonadota bacterium]